MFIEAHTQIEYDFWYHSTHLVGTATGIQRKATGTRQVTPRSFCSYRQTIPSTFLNQFATCSTGNHLRMPTLSHQEYCGGSCLEVRYPFQLGGHQNDHKTLSLAVTSLYPGEPTNSSMMLFRLRCNFHQNAFKDNYFATRYYFQLVYQCVPGVFVSMSSASKTKKFFSLLTSYVLTASATTRYRQVDVHLYLLQQYRKNIIIMQLVKKNLEDFDEQTKFDQSNTSYFT